MGGRCWGSPDSHRTHIDEMNARSHPLCQSDVEGADLGMDVREERQPGPSSNFHDCGITFTL